jgi:hypothetical protein
MTQDATRPFLATIEADRDQQITLIQAGADTEIERICAKAHTAARQLQRHTNVRLRQELSIRRHKEISRVQARIRRKRWQSLKQLQHGINEQVLDRMYLAWSEPIWQWDWCYFWLQAALGRDAKTPFRVAITKSALPDTLAYIRKWAEQNRISLSFDEGITELGLTVSWADFELDGLISGQRRSIENAVLARLTPLLPRPHPHQIEIP